MSVATAPPPSPVPVVFALVALLLCACGGVEQELWVSADGSGHFRVRYDGSETLSMLDMLGGSLDQLPGVTSPGEEDGNAGPTGLLQVLAGAERFDTSFAVLTILPDSVRDGLTDVATVRARAAAAGEPMTEEEARATIAQLAPLEDGTVMVHLDKPAGQLTLGKIACGYRIAALGDRLRLED